MRVHVNFRARGCAEELRETIVNNAVSVDPNSWSLPFIAIRTADGYVYVKADDVQSIAVTE